MFKNTNLLTKQLDIRTTQKLHEKYSRLKYLQYVDHAENAELLVGVQDWVQYDEPPEFQDFTAFPKPTFFCV